DAQAARRLILEKRAADLQIARMFRMRHHAPGTPPATLVSPDKTVLPPVITLIEYDAQTIEEKKVSRVDDVFACKTNGKVSWINIDGIGDGDLLRKLGAHFGLHPLALEDVQNICQRPKIEEYADHFFIVTK